MQAKPTPRLILTLALAAGLGLTASPVWAKARGFTGNRPVTLQDYLPHRMSNEGYSEQWSMAGFLGQEESRELSIAFQLMTTNIGVGDDKGKMEFRYRGPGGLKYDHNKRCNVRGKLEGTAVVLFCGPITVRSTLEGFTAKFASKELSAEIHVRNTVPAWRPGNGRLTMDKDGDVFYDLLLSVPRGRLEAWVDYKGEVRHHQGAAFADQSYFSATPDETTKNFIRMKSVDENMSLLFSTFCTPDGSRFGYVLAADDAGKVVASADPKIEILQEFPAPNRKRYALASEFKIQAGGPGGALEVHLLGGYLKNTKDLLKGLNSVEKWVANRYSDPFSYSMDGVLRVRWSRTGAAPIDSEQDGSYLVQHVNP